MDNVYKCRICYRMYHDKEVVIDLSSEEAKEEQIAAKILCALSIMITDHDPIKHICRICYGQVEVNFRFATACRKNNAKYIENLTNEPSNNVVKTEYKKFMRIPVHALFNKYHFDVKGLFGAVTSFLNDTNENLSSTKHFENFDRYFGLNNSISNQFDIENDTPIPESSSVFEVNIPSTNGSNVETDDVIIDQVHNSGDTDDVITDNIHNSGIDLNNRSLRPIINTNNINHATNASTSRNILLNAHIPVMSSNNLSHTINTSSGIFRIIPTVGTNNVNNATNNINQSRNNRPIICKNNVIKSTRFCILSKPQILMNGRHVDTNTVQNLGSAAHLNQPNVNSPSIVQSTVNNHSDSVQSKRNGQINDDEVICLDDDDDDDDNNHIHNDNNNNGNGNNLQRLENSINPLNQWILPPPSPLLNRNTNTNNNAKTNFPKSYQNKNKNNANNIIKIKSAPSTNISSEEMTVTPDMPLSTSDEGSLLNQGEDMYFDVDNEPTESLLVEPETEPSRVLPDTGFHFLFSTDETVDLTTKDNTPKKKPVIKQKKTPKPKKAVASKKQTQKTSTAQSNPKTKSQLIRSSTSSTIEKKQTRKTSIALHNLKTKGQLLRSSTLPTTEQSDTPLTKPRPKRASAIDSAAENRNSGLCKLGKHIESRDCRWTLPVINNISLPMFQCPICDVFLYSPESRKTHEVLKHSSLLESIHEPVNVVSTPRNTEPLTEQLTLFNYLQLCVTSKHKTKAVHQLAKRTNLLKAFKTLGHNTIDSFKCKYCPYTTDLIFALWAHMTSKHLYLKCDSEKKSCLYCFLCNRILTKRTTMLKHLDACINKHNELPITNNSSKRLICVHCNEGFDSLIELEKHTWGHAKK
ncbi:GATA zinc finger domain-containing protein 8-like isoform X2 [Metopolophium dirhodum]|uniref:GATA zinc finger domain-containing protein 8-like isoform X2 n=1 Tax=Metopolophium dirhodum TaxID=44670 RepID=UPI00298FC04F|nr:GATA zinc finger domain-containing protein 8-like isoform X2 [Metopolophium dirhodum]